MKPDFQLIADGDDVTAKIRDRLVSLRLSDEVGLRSDTLDLVLDDRPPAIKLPTTAVELDLSLGYEGNLMPMGVFIVDEVGGSSPPARLTVRARAANLSKGTTEAGRGRGIADPKTRSWHDSSVGALATSVADEAGWSVTVHPDAAGISLSHLDQVHESDWHLLMRTAQEHDLVVKAAAGKLVVVPAGAKETASGQPAPALVMDSRHVQRWRVVWADREAVKSCVASYYDYSQGLCGQVVAGSGSPRTSLRRKYASQASAQAAADAALARRARGQGRLEELSLVGDARLSAGLRVTIEGVSNAINGTWRTTRVEHSLSGSGFTTRLEGEAS